MDTQSSSGRNCPPRPLSAIRLDLAAQRALAVVAALAHLLHQGILGHTGEDNAGPPAAAGTRSAGM